ncbi:hypothetical protein C8Q80DRAFT_330501 [Daedaleopsis nitida]|nr:hypothetical protein C8Q80DRAFT_330501 [Daedaleopsis nitida]
MEIGCPSSCVPPRNRAHRALLRCRFNIYIYDYCVKRGFQKTAHELMHEAQIPPASHPPINAKQGLLFECVKSLPRSPPRIQLSLVENLSHITRWWSVFWVLFTAKSNGNGSDDALLYTQHQAQMQNVQKQPRGGAPIQQPRYPNGQRPPNQIPPQTNGVPPGSTQPGAMPNGTHQNTVPFPGNAPQPNGIPGSSAGPPVSAGSSQPPGMPPGLTNQRVMPPQQQRAMNGAPPFQSPTMAHSPPNAPGAHPPNTIGSMGPVGTNQPLTQIGNSSRPGAMHPPTGPPVPMAGQQPTPQSGYPQLGRSPSNPGSPAQNNMVHQSPSFAARQPPGNIDMELHRIPPPTLQKIKQDMNMGDKDSNLMTMEEKQQVVGQFRRMYMKPPGPSAMPPGQQGSMQHPSGLRNTQLPPNAQPGANVQRGNKRNSTSPGQEPEQLPKNESSPPANKRPRTSPAGADQGAQPPMTPMYPPHPSQPGGPSMQHPMPPGNMMRQMQVPFPGQPMPGMNNANTMLGHGLGTPHMSPMSQPMNPPMMQGPPGGMNNQQMHQYRQSMAALHKSPHMMMPGGVPSPSGSDAQGGGMPSGPPPGNRMGPNKPPMAGMLPPPSPTMAAKAPGGPRKSEDGVAPNASPQNAAAGIGGQMPGQNPPLQGGPPQASTPAPQTPNASTMTAPSPSAIMNSSTPQMSNHPPPPPPPTADALDPSALGPFDFQGLDGFDPSFLNGDSSLNFERDFAAWFDPENAA